MTLHTIIFIGRSGCGKGTQAQLLRNKIHDEDEEKQRILYVETGEHFRKFINGDSFSSKLSKEIYAKDERQPDFLACWMWSNMLIEELDQDMHMVFDGAPRAKAEAEVLTTALKFYKRKKPTVIHINVSRKWSEEKLLKRGRFDDKSLDRIDKRLDWFDKDVAPALEHYKSDPYYTYLEVDGEQTVQEVFNDIVEAYENAR